MRHEDERMSLARAREAIDGAWRELSAIQARIGSGRDYVGLAYSHALDGERQHQAFGRRLTRGNAGRPKASHDTRARYFVCKWALERVNKPRSYADAADVRLDALYGYAARDFLRRSAQAPEFQRWCARWRPLFEGIDYARDLSSGAL